MASVPIAAWGSFPDLEVAGRMPVSGLAEHRHEIDFF